MLKQTWLCPTGCCDNSCIRWWHISGGCVPHGEQEPSSRETSSLKFWVDHSLSVFLWATCSELSPWKNFLTRWQVAIFSFSHVCFCSSLLWWSAWDSWFNRSIRCALRVCFIQASLYISVYQAADGGSTAVSHQIQACSLLNLPLWWECPACLPHHHHFLCGLTCFGFRVLLLGEMLGMGQGMLILGIIFVSHH